MDAREETLSILNNIWVKLQGLPNATPIELGAFFVILTFICGSPLCNITRFSISFKSDPVLMLFFYLLSRSGVHLNGSADLRDLLLLLLSQNQDQGIYSLSNYAPHKELRMVQNGLKTQGDWHSLRKP